LHGHFRHIDEMLVDSPHMGDPGVHRNKVVVGIPWSIRVVDSMFSPKLRYPLVRVRLGVREEL
jgi:hypothetical protein